MFENYPHLRRNLIIISFTVAPLLIAAFIAYVNNAMLFTPHGYLSINSVPNSISIAYDNNVRAIQANSGVIPMPIGTYTVSFTSSGFGAYSEKISITKDQTYTVWFLLTPYTDDAKSEYGDDKYSLIKEGVAGHNSYTSSQSLVPKYPILQFLPINTLTYSIELCPPYAASDGSIDKIGVCITISDISDATQVDAAINELTSRSFDPDNFAISINDHHYPTSLERTIGSCPLLDSGVCQ